MHRSRERAVALLALLAAAFLLSGCASLGTQEMASDPGPEIRPDAPAEYDVLVAQQHASEGRLAEALAAYERAVAKDPDAAYLHRVLADALARSNRLDEALVHAQRAYELDPDDQANRYLLAQLYRVKRDPASAEGILLDAEGEPRDADAAFLLYQIYLEMDRLDDALLAAEWMVENDADTMRAHVAVANAYQKMDRPMDAERALRDALEIDPENLRLYSALARSMRERGDRAGEIAIYREILDEHPDDHATLVSLADAQMSENDLEGALATFDVIERRYPADLRSTTRYGFLLYEARRFSEAAERFERVLRVSPEEHEVAFFLGYARRRANQDDAAIAAFESIPPDHRNYAQARTQIAGIYEKRADYAKALGEIEKALEVAPSRELELYSATLRAKGGDFDGAVEYLEKLIEAEPGNDELVYNLGVVYGENGKSKQALIYMRQALEMNPDNASAMNYIGYTWAEKGEKLDEAESLIVRATELRPDDGYIVDSLGWVFYMRARPLVASGQHEEARIYLERAIAELERADELTGGDPVISEHLGDTYLLMNERRRALDLFEEANQLGPRGDEQPDLSEKLETLRREFE